MFSKKGLFFYIAFWYILSTLISPFLINLNFTTIIENGYKNISTPLLKTFEWIDNLRNDMTE